MKIKIINESRLPAKLLHEIVQFAMPSSKPTADRVRILFRDGIHPHGRASFHAKIWIPPKNYSYPVRFKAGNGYQGTVCNNEMETIVDLVAHELRHVKQHREKKIRMLRQPGTRRKGRAAQERDADLYAMRKLDEWRRREQEAMPMAAKSAPACHRPEYC